MLVTAPALQETLAQCLSIFGTLAQPVAPVQLEVRAAISEKEQCRLERYRKCHPATFSGLASEDAKGFIEECHRILCTMGVAMSSGVSFTVFQLRGAAYLWWRAYELALLAASGIPVTPRPQAPYHALPVSSAPPARGAFSGGSQFAELHSPGCREDVSGVELARVYIREIVGLHGVPVFIIYDRAQSDWTRISLILRSRWPSLQAEYYNGDSTNNNNNNNNNNKKYYNGGSTKNNNNEGYFNGGNTNDNNNNNNKKYFNGGSTNKNNNYYYNDNEEYHNGGSTYYNNNNNKEYHNGGSTNNNNINNEWYFNGDSTNKNNYKKYHSGG
ncbi:PREDICTED: ras-related protein RabX-like [Nicotiana attenuata]|uniref:ras-related protein RabX-like n=1 Tax=Nicotiana attenuata TaxID=49451 RepID=UPI000905D26D|nr:PREDICTED: ras-related protein RabX-like [Nicotiana attenuata]